MSRFSFLRELKPDRPRLLWIFALGLPLITVGILLTATLLHLSKGLPSLEQLEQIEPRLITRVFDKDSVLVHEFYVERRIWTPLDSTTPHLRQAILAIEDRVFFSHWGINVWAVPRAIFEYLAGSNRIRGASTLTQQLSKNLFLTPERSLVRKIREAITAVLIERTYTKNEILEFYLNTVYMGAGTYGFQAAAQHYFNKSLLEIDLSEAATLAGLLQRPEGFRPDRHPEAALARRNTVLFAMRESRMIDAATYEKAFAQPLLEFQQQDNRRVGPYFVEEIRKYLERKYGENSLYAEGISVYSTLDQDIQKTAEAAVEERLKIVRRRLKHRHATLLNLPRRYNMSIEAVVNNFDSVYARFSKEYLAKDTSKIDSLRRFPDSTRYRPAQVGAILIENSTGAIRMMVGGSNFQLTKFNRATQATRQPGSAFKPFVFAAAMDNGASPCDSVNDQPITIPDPLDTNKFWRPSNYDNTFSGFMTIRRALYLSKNLPAIQVGMQYGLGNVVSYSRKFGLKSPLSAVPSLAIGSIGATLMEMTSAYTVFPNEGTRIEPYYIEYIVGRNGEPIERNIKVEHEVLRKPSAFLMVNMLQDVNIRGTAARIWSSGFHHPSGGKTGTTNEYTDAWYIGFTKQYTMGVWVGVDAHIPMGRGHTGGDNALPVWLEVMKHAHRDLPRQPFPIPAGIIGISVCEHSGHIATDACNNKSACLFSAGNQPSQRCTGKHETRRNEQRDATLFGAPRQEDSEGERVRKTF